jgi:hypothetical protein
MGEINKSKYRTKIYSTLWKEQSKPLESAEEKEYYSN